jgi:hypothetical protein
MRIEKENAMTNWTATAPHIEGSSTFVISDDNGEVIGAAYSREVAALFAAASKMLDACEHTIKRVDDWMDFGERECPFCMHHYKHDPGCPYLRIKAALATARGETPPDSETQDLSGRSGG